MKPPYPGPLHVPSLNDPYPDQDRECDRLYESGLSLNDISRRLGLTVGCVRGSLARMGTQMRKRGPRPAEDDGRR